jgi:hypothetical protein
MPIAAWLMAMLTPMTARILLALGFSVVTVAGFDVALGTLKDLFISWTNQIPAAGFQLALLAGCGEALGIIFGAITTRIMIWKIQNTTRILGVSS